MNTIVAQTEANFVNYVKDNFPNMELIEFDLIDKDVIQAKFIDYSNEEDGEVIHLLFKVEDEGFTDILNDKVENMAEYKADCRMLLQLTYQFAQFFKSKRKMPKPELMHDAAVQIREFCDKNPEFTHEKLIDYVYGGNVSAIQAYLDK